MNKSSSEQMKGRNHLTTDERYELQAMLNRGMSLRAIAKQLNRNASTILREIKRHCVVTPPKRLVCINKRNCAKHHVCGNLQCWKFCKNCSRCYKKCPDFVEMHCEKVQTPPYLCNGCCKIRMCEFERREYKAYTADNQYRTMLIDRRNGFDLTGEELNEINETVSPLIMQGLSLYHIKQMLGDRLSVSESTLRRLINNCELDARNIDLRAQVKYKPRKKKAVNPARVQASKAGHLYSDYLEYIKENDVSIVQMDCVEGRQGEKATLLTLHLPVFCLQLAYMLNEQTAQEVVATLDEIEETLGKDLFQEVFGLILTDNGSEFTDIEGMERSVFGGTRTKVYFCEPNRSDQKGNCENNHRLIRYIIPKGTSLEQYTQKDIDIMMDNINSYSRNKLHGKTPYEAAELFLPAEFFSKLRLQKIPKEAVLLKPALLKYREH